MDSANSRWEETLRTTQQGAARDSAQQAQALAQISRDAAALREALTGLAPQLQRVLESAREELTRTVSDQQAKISGAVQRQHDQVQQFVGALLRAGGRLEELAQLRIQLEQGLVKMAGSEGITAALAAERAAVTDLRDALKEMEPVLRRFSEKPIDVKVHLVAGPPSVAT
jgi:ABC-type transporter Mla subunit MlaD